MNSPARKGPRRPALIPALPHPAYAVPGGDFLSAIGSGLTMPCLFVYAHQVLHLGYTTSGLAVAAIALASLAGNPLGGVLAASLLIVGGLLLWGSVFDARPPSLPKTHPVDIAAPVAAGPAEVRAGTAVRNRGRRQRA